MHVQTSDMRTVDKIRLSQLTCVLCACFSALVKRKIGLSPGHIQKLNMRRSGLILGLNSGYLEI